MVEIKRWDNPKDSEFTEMCPHFCLKKTNWIPYEKGIHTYAKPCPIHRPGWQHPEDRPPVETADEKKRAREERTSTESETERADW